jgi:uncharacterized protein
MDDWQVNLVDDDAGLTRILREARTVAVLGAKDHPSAPANYVPAYLASRGYRLRPVNPRLAGRPVLGEIAVGTLADLTEPVDVIDVFRRPEYLPGHAAEILRLPWTPAVVWFQLGIRHDAAAATLARSGIRVVQDRCMMPEHRRLIGAGGPAMAPRPATLGPPRQSRGDPR